MYYVREYIMCSTQTDRKCGKRNRKKIVVERTNCNGGARRTRARTGVHMCAEEEKEKRKELLYSRTILDRPNDNAQGEETSRLGGRDEYNEKRRIIFRRIVIIFYNNAKCTRRGEKNKNCSRAAGAVRSNKISWSSAAIVSLTHTQPRTSKLSCGRVPCRPWWRGRPRERRRSDHVTSRGYMST